MSLRQPSEAELPGRLPWLLVFRVAVATALLALTAFGEWRSLVYSRLATVLYLVVVGNYVAALAIGLLLRARAASTVVATVYLVLSVGSAFAVVQVTGVIDSAFTFLYLLAILDGAIIGGRRLALASAAACAVAYGAQVVLQVYDVLPAGRVVSLPDWEFAASGIVNFSAFYLVAFLAGHLAELLRRARQAATLATADLVQARALHAAILEALPVGVLALDGRGLILAANASAAAILRASGPLVGARLPAAFDGALPAAGTQQVLRLDLAGEERVLGVVRSGPARLPADAEGDGTRPLEVVVVEDRTELSLLEARLAARERLASLGEVAAAIAHEIRNPLAALSGALELLLTPGEVPAASVPLRDIVRREIERLDRLLEDFLQYARPQPIEPSRFDVAAIAHEVCAVARADERYAAHPVQVVAPERLEAEVDAGRLRQVLWNLLRNALEASPPGGAVELRLAREDVGVVVELRDHGAGVDPAIRPHLFEPFRTTKAQGTGLGLAVVHRIVDSHGGTVELLDAPGGGTMARVRLPR